MKAQFSCKVEGTVKQNGKNLNGAVVSLSNNTGPVKEVVTGPTGAFSFSLEPNEEYTMYITKPGYIKSEIVFSTIGFTDEEAQTFKNVLKPEVSLFELPEDAQILAKVNDVLATPLKSYYYSAEKKSLITDEVLDLSMQKEFAKIQKIAEAAPKAVVKDEATINYQNAIVKADKALAEKDYTGAKKTYEEALNYKPSESYPKTKLSEINKITAAQDKALADAAKEKERLEKEALAKADAEKKLAEEKEKQRLQQEVLAKAAEEKRLAAEKALAEQKAIADAKEKERLEKEALAKA
ncbi:MAG TPA: carboxypeptidase regulatory-like domain-containing protein, partial [Chlamydiales bacterium]|nr:carboxypeptidase regulatory-like domain-containing protein [Chlamydiales bacterium]